MVSRAVVVGSRIGLHGRPAAAVARVAAAQPVPVRISVAGRAAVDASSVIAVLSLGARGGDTVTLEADGPGAEQAVAAVADVLSTDLDTDLDADLDADHAPPPPGEPADA